MSASWRTQRHSELDSGTIQLVVDTSVVPRHPQAKLGDPVKQKIFTLVTASASVVVHSEDLDCFVGLRPPRNDEKLVTLRQAQIFTPRNDSKLNVPSPIGGRLGWGITHREKTNVIADWFRHGIDCRRNLLPMRFRVKHGMTEVGGVVCYQ